MIAATLIAKTYYGWQTWCVKLVHRVLWYLCSCCHLQETFIYKNPDNS